MDRNILIQETMDKIHLLPDAKIQEIKNFVEFLLRKIDDNILFEGIQKLSSDSKTFEYLKNDEDLYSVKNIIDKRSSFDIRLDKITTHFASEKILSKDWLKPIEDEAWKDL